MNLETINKWLDEKYGCSFTRLEELHDFYFEKYCDLKKENQELKKQLEENKDKINWYENFEINKTIDKLRIKHNNQQKEFISYLENEIKRITTLDETKVSQCSIMTMRCMKSDYKQILQKYKSIIGENDV